MNNGPNHAEGYLNRDRPTLSETYGLTAQDNVNQGTAMNTRTPRNKKTINVFQEEKGSTKRGFTPRRRTHSGEAWETALSPTKKRIDRQNLVQRAIEQALDVYHELDEEKAEDNGNQKPLFFLIKEMAVLRDSEGVTAGEAFDLCDTALQGRLMDPNTDHWDDHFHVSRDVAEIYFQTEWGHIRLPGGETDPIKIAIQRAARQPLSLTGKSAVSHNPTYAKFVSIAGWLQVVRGNHAILLPIELLGKKLGITGKSVSRFREQAEKDGFLKCLWRQDRRNKANEYRFNVGIFAELANDAARGCAKAYNEAIHLPL